MGSSFLHVKKATFEGNAPNGSLDITTSWKFVAWNDLDIQSQAKYAFALEPISTPEWILSLPHKNAYKFALRNVIPTFNVLTLVDSKLYYQLQQPKIRYWRMNRYTCSYVFLLVNMFVCM